MKLPNFIWNYLLASKKVGSLVIFLWSSRNMNFMEYEWNFWLKVSFVLFPFFQVNKLFLRNTSMVWKLWYKSLMNKDKVLIPFSLKLFQVSLHHYWIGWILNLDVRNSFLSPLVTTPTMHLLWSEPVLEAMETWRLISHHMLRPPIVRKLFTYFTFLN